MAVTPNILLVCQCILKNCVFLDSDIAPEEQQIQHHQRQYPVEQIHERPIHQEQYSQQEAIQEHYQYQPHPPQQYEPTQPCQHRGYQSVPVHYQQVPYGYAQPAPYYPPFYQPQPVMYMPTVPVPVPMNTVPHAAPVPMHPTLVPRVTVPQAQGTVAQPLPAEVCHYDTQQGYQPTVPQYPGSHPANVVPAVHPVQPVPAPEVPSQPTGGLSPVPELQLPVPLKSSIREPLKRGMFEAAKAIAKTLAANPQSPEAASSHHSEPSPSPTQRRTAYPSPTSFQVLDYNQTTVLAFAYELDPCMDEDVHNCHQLAMHVNVHPSVIKVFIFDFMYA